MSKKIGMPLFCIGVAPPELCLWWVDYYQALAFVPHASHLATKIMLLQSN